MGCCSCSHPQQDMLWGGALTQNTQEERGHSKRGAREREQGADVEAL